MAETQPVILMAKRGLGEAATAWAQGGIVGVVDKEHDSIDSHVADTLDAGAGLVVESTARYIAEGHPLCILAGKEYGSGSSRDWAAKGPWMQGIKVVIA